MINNLNQNCATAEVKVGQVYEAAQETEKKIDRLTELLVHLRERLQSVLNPAPTSKCSDIRKEQLQPSRAPFAERIDILQDKTNGLISTVEDLIDRLEI